ncbi:hypothetical protein DM01DRAFT_1314168 [Hesseltinella vesiculosa]|uniref:Rho GTPase activation protein n=1 Tax=Hesseltinella vesiculosa TaxID=101127 RepID=A0A1X2GYC4_9FUNG|nr:hypothetical protein DM01DRAFT_1314168 [Hesseltinella vesiculosa]
MSYVSLAKDIVSEWMNTFYDAQHLAAAYPLAIPRALSECNQSKEMAAQNLNVVIYEYAKPHPGLVLQSQEDRHIQGGTVPALVHELLFETQTKGKDFTYAFLLTYATFTTTCSIFGLIKGYTQALKGTDLWICLWDRLFDLFSIWCERFAYDVDGDLVKNVTELLDMEYPASMQDRAKELRCLIRQTLDDNLHVLEYAQAQRPVGSKTTHSIPRSSTLTTAVVDNTSPTSDSGDATLDLSNLMATGLTPFVFLAIDPTAFAQQIYVFHAAQHDRHRYQLLSALSYASKCQMPPQMLNVLLYTTQSPHFLTRLIWSQLLVHCRMQTSENPGVLRTLLLEHWIRVGVALMELKDMTGWTAVAMGICSLEVARLKEAWKAVDRSLVWQVAQVWTPLIADHGLFSIHIWMDGWETNTRRMGMYAEVLDHDTLSLNPSQPSDQQQQHLQPPLLESLPLPKTPSTTTPASTPPTTPTGTTGSQTTSLFNIVEPLQDYFLSSVNEVSSVPHDFKFLHECSLACEPQTFGQVNHVLLPADQIRDLLPAEKPLSPSSSPTSSTTSPSTDVDSTLDSLDDNPVLVQECNFQSFNTTAFWQQFHFPAIFSSSRITLIDPELLPHGKPSNQPWSLTSLPRCSHAFLSGLNDVRPLRPGMSRSARIRTMIGDSKDEMQSLVTDEQRKALLDYFDSYDIRLRKVQEELDQQRKSQPDSHLKQRCFYVYDHDLVMSGSMVDKPDRTLFVKLRAGLLHALLKCLVQGIEPCTGEFQSQWSSGNIDHVMMDDEQNLRSFFSTYRVYCSPAQLMQLLQQQFTSARPKGAIQDVYKSQGAVDLFSLDWLPVASVQIRVVHLLMYWIDRCFYDFVDQINLFRSIFDSISTAKAYLDIWHVSLMQQYEEIKGEKQIDEQNQIALMLGGVISNRLEQLQMLVMRKALSPSYDWQALPYDTIGTRHADELYRQLTNGAHKFSVTLQLASNKSTVFSVSQNTLDTSGTSVVDRYSAFDLLEQADRAVGKLFSSVVQQDWIQLCNVLELQAMDHESWIPKPKASRHDERPSQVSATLSPVCDFPGGTYVVEDPAHVPTDQIIISDIFTSIECARRSMISPLAFTADDLLLAMPSSIQYLYCMHFIIRSWVTHEISAEDIDLLTRVSRIDTFLQMIVLSRQVSRRMDLFQEMKKRQPAGKYVPGFVEYAVTSALVSPEVRVFTKAWKWLAQKYGVSNLDTLAAVMKKKSETASASSPCSPAALSSPALLLVPSLGWIFERVIDLCLAIPSTYQGMILIDKRTYLQQFFTMVINAQVLLKDTPEPSSINMSFLLYPNDRKRSWKHLKQDAAKENKLHHHHHFPQAASPAASPHHRPPAGTHISLKHGVFSRLVQEQVTKMKYDLKERLRLDQMQQAKAECQQQRPTVLSQQSFGHIVPSPSSSTGSSIGQSFGRRHRHQRHASSFDDTKPSLVINLVQATTSICSGDEKRPFVFRIVTEEGAQYLLQADSLADMQDWLDEINRSVRHGTAKRQSILAAEQQQQRSSTSSASSIPINASATPSQSPGRTSKPSRKSIYGIPLGQLFMRDHGKLPYPLTACIEEIERRGLDEVGIYRVAGSGAMVQQLKKEFNTSSHVNLDIDYYPDINVIADALKQFIRDLPEPLLTFDLYDDFIEASATVDHDNRLYKIKQAVHKLPHGNYLVLKRLVEHLVIVTDYESINHMYATNLAIVFGPTLLQPAPGPASFTTSMSNLGHHQNIVKYLVLHYHYLFDVEDTEE